MTQGPTVGPGRAQARPDVFARSSNTGLILLPQAGEPVKLNGPASMVWDLLVDEMPVEQMVTFVAGAFDQPREIVEPLIDATLRLLVDAGVARAV